ncbi:surface-associated interspersed protein 13.1 (SURFIN 13.1) (SURF13.1) [Plasmodium ovale curtisi]|uniref:Surface-associated interspersed protein 13.1 (SURFIN 13.1) (SURF13.1) n=1 Tax=Plasmodium ovale curtisi TaxID=864141 RepID=A0A1A8XDF0_PLAOA|nr:surface-associated interspersed protein 13.1 (SURFIN 13.1) (SURF13.1) [Plasmodium ovale curtisi]SBT02744.1 surface-associated interspersed protein 13.1 (SURFIN 13.1) (SURF13.1) [Plasmodium ovale curtisi]
MGNDVYIKLLKMNKYKKKRKTKKNKKKTSLIEVHIEVFEDNKNYQWDLRKVNYLKMCLCEFINEKSETYRSFQNVELTVNNMKNEKTIQDI